MMELNIDNLKKVVKDILDEWAGICHLYSVVHEFAEMYTGINPDTHVENRGCHIRNRDRHVGLFQELREGWNTTYFIPPPLEKIPKPITTKRV